MITTPIQRMWADDVPFLAYRGLAWESVRRVRYTCYQRFEYHYPGPVRDLRQQLIVAPPRSYGDQRLIHRDIHVSPTPDQICFQVDRYGNTVCHIEIAQFEESVSFDIALVVERTMAAPKLPAISPEQAAQFLAPTALTTCDAQLHELAVDFAERYPDPLERASQISEWVYNAFQYGHGSTGVETNAADALKIGRGLCQDYSHVMIALCRATGLPARYISGHMLGEGGSHAWVEVILTDPNDGTLRPVGFDPTNRRQPNLGYTTIAVGRDYRDVAPTSGRYTASYSGKLSYTKRAGLTQIDYSNMTIGN